MKIGKNRGRREWYLLWAHRRDPFPGGNPRPPAEGGPRRTTPPRQDTDVRRGGEGRGSTAPGDGPREQLPAHGQPGEAPYSRRGPGGSPRGPDDGGAGGWWGRRGGVEDVLPPRGGPAQLRRRRVRPVRSNAWGRRFAGASGYPGVTGMLHEGVLPRGRRTGA